MREFGLTEKEQELYDKLCTLLNNDINDQEDLEETIEAVDELVEELLNWD